MLGKDRPFHPPVFNLDHSRILGWDKYSRYKDASFSDQRFEQWSSGLQKTSFWKKFKCQTWLHLHFLNRSLTVARHFLNITLVDGKPSHPIYKIGSWKAYFLLFHELAQAFLSIKNTSPYFPEFLAKYAHPLDSWLINRCLLPFNFPFSHDMNILDSLFHQVVLWQQGKLSVPSRWNLDFKKISMEFFF